MNLERSMCTMNRLGAGGRGMYSAVDARVDIVPCVVPDCAIDWIDDDIEARGNAISSGVVSCRGSVVTILLRLGAVLVTLPLG